MSGIEEESILSMKNQKENDISAYQGKVLDMLCIDVFLDGCSVLTFRNELAYPRSTYYNTMILSMFIIYSIDPNSKQNIVSHLFIFF